MSSDSIPAQNGHLIEMHPEAIGAEAVLRLAQRAARHAEEAAQKALNAFDEARRARAETKAVRVEVAALSVAVAEGHAALLLGLHQISQTQHAVQAFDSKQTIVQCKEAQELLLAQARRAEDAARRARLDAEEVRERAEEITGRYDLRELARQSKVDAEDRAIVQRVATAFLTQEEQDAKAEETARALAHAVRLKRNRIIWKVVERVALVIIAAGAGLLAARLGIHVPTE